MSRSFACRARKRRRAFQRMSRRRRRTIDTESRRSWRNSVTKYKNATAFLFCFHCCAFIDCQGNTNGKRGDKTKKSHPFRAKALASETKDVSSRFNSPEITKTRMPLWHRSEILRLHWGDARKMLEWGWRHKRYKDTACRTARARWKDTDKIPPRYCKDTAKIPRRCLNGAVEWHLKIADIEMIDRFTYLLSFHWFLS